MKKSLLSIPKILFATFTGISCASFLLAQPSLANPEQPFSSLESDRNSNSLFGNGSDFNMYDLIHRANFGTLNWNPQEQNQQINDAAAAFKARQRQLLQKQQPQTINSPNSSLNTNGENLQQLIILPADK